jgi:acylphosphatase
MQKGIHWNRCGVVLVALAVCGAAAWAQETRSTLSGRVLDTQGGVVANVVVVVRNTDTGVTLSLKTNDTGFYSAGLLLPGNYEITAEMTGFKKLLRKGVALPVASSLVVDLTLEVGGVTETVSVSAEAPLLETTSVTSGRVIDNKTLMELPVMGNSAITLVRLTPGIQTGGVVLYLAPHSNIGGSDYNINGNVGGNSWTLDGSPNQGPSRRLAYLPYTDSIAEFKVETNNFDAGVGQSSGAAITMISKSGNNAFHGTATWQHWQQRWQGTPFFVKQNYFRSIAAAEAAGNTALANQIRNTDQQLPGRSNNWGASGGGPVIIPKVFNGRNKLFWFFTYNALKDVKSEEPITYNRTVPTQLARNGDFSDMLSLPNSAQYIVYDPATTVPDPARPTHYIRTPFPNNVIPRARFVNPAYDAISKLYPTPNNPPAPGAQPVFNYLSNNAPYNWDYKAFSNRVDYQMNEKIRMYGRWSFNNFGPEDRGDWTYSTARGLNIGGLVRNNKGGNIDVVWSPTSATVVDFNVAMNQFREGSIRPYALQFKPSDIGLPKYLDDKAGEDHILPQMNLNPLNQGANAITNGYSVISPGGISNWTRYRQATGKVEVTHVRGNHTLRAGFDNRYQFRTSLRNGNTSGNFTFSSLYVRKDEDGFTPNSNLGLGWAAFILGVPTSIGVQTLDTYAMLTPYYGGFVQDTWRLTPKLTLNLGLRIEHESGATERFDRMIGGFDPTISLPITNAAQAAYAASPIPELPASQFKVVGGNTYVGQNGAPRSLVKPETMWLPRVGVAYQWNSKTVIRAGYGLYYDTINVLNFGPDQTGYTQNTGTPIATIGSTFQWNPLFGANSPASLGSPLRDPFPVRADGTRFTDPTRNALGSMSRVGVGYGFTNYNQDHARQQRWRFSVQREFGRNWAIDVAYSGSRSDRIGIGHKLDYLPEPFWGRGTVRANDIATNMTSNVTNPFRITNFASLQQSNPLLYTIMSQNSFFTSATIQKHRLLRVIPHMNDNLTNNQESVGKAETHDFELSLQKRFSQGFNVNVGYAALKVNEKTFFFNQFDPEPSWRTSNNGRPHRLTITGVYEWPFGRGKRFGNSAGRWLNLLIGGWQMAGTYEFQPGGLLDWGNVFYYGSDLSAIRKVDRTFDSWFNKTRIDQAYARSQGIPDNSCAVPAGFTGFEGRASCTANAYNRRTFPTRVADLRADKTSLTNANVSKNLPISERVNLQLRLDALNVQNRSQMAGPNTDPLSTNFGRVTSQSQATNRWLQVQMRLTF